jgi:hypothetical protein
VTIPQIFIRTGGPITATTHEAGCNPKIVSIGCMFVEIVTESKTYRIYKVVLLTIKVAACNASGASKFIGFPQHNTAILDVGLLLYERV